MNPKAIIQSRMESTRLPGKALKDIGGFPLTEHVVRRTHEAIPDPILAIPETAPNDELEQEAQKWPCDIVRGPEQDVLQRFVLAMEQCPEADPILRVTGDNPLISTRMMNELAQRLGEADWARWQWLPFGVGNSVYTRQSVMEAHERATSQEDREHVTLYIRRRDEYTSNIFTPPPEYRAPGLRLTVDTESDLQLIRELHDRLDTGPFELSGLDAIEHLVQNPELKEINRGIQQKVYTPQTTVLYTMNRGQHWGTGHWARYQMIRRHEPDQTEENIRWYGLLGNVSGPDDGSKQVISRSRNPLNGTTIKLWSRRAGARLVIQDVKQTSENLVTSLKEEGVRVIGIEDRGPGRQHMDAVIDPNIYEDTLPDDSVSPDNRYYGPDYAVIDPAFRENRRKQTPDELETIGIFVGGTDPNGLGPAFLKSTLNPLSDVEYHYFGPHDLPLNDWSIFQASHCSKEQVVERGLVENPARAFGQMDLMVIAGGVIKFEVACLNLPAIIVPQNQEQYENSARFIENNDLNWPLFQPGSNPGAWAAFLNDHPPAEHLVSWSENVNHVVDGRGIERFYDVVQDVLHNGDPPGG